MNPKAEAAASLETKQLQKLAVTACAGFLAALLPLLIQTSIYFVIVLMLILLTIIALKRSMLSLRHDHESAV